MRICIVGAGYVGLTTAAALADFGHEVLCVDMEESKINCLRQGKVPIYEPGLDELITKNVKNNKLFFSSLVEESIKEYPVILIAVGTPSKDDGSSNLMFVHRVIDVIASTTNVYKIIITKSTVPPGTNEWIHKRLIEKGIDEDLFDVVSNPEFLREGFALRDLYHPNKIVFGTKTSRPIKNLKKLYYRGKAPYIFTSLTGAELIKYASNAFLATKISFANEMARICDAYEVDYDDIAKGIGTDPRIGRYFLNSGLGFGGSCLPKDLSSLKHSAVKKNVETKLLDAVREVNDTQIDLYLNKLTTELPDLTGKRITIWGVTFKPDTDDLRSSPAVMMIKKLLEKGCQVHAYDPMVQLELSGVYSHTNQYESVKNSDALIISTEWQQFLETDWAEVKSRMKGTIVLDARNCLDGKLVRKFGFLYLRIG
ncbi:UDP-glucose/GDP-mannose dehydrogenase family protein [Desulfosporosinus sp.]|uniref:UDP-glucose dehydrogenase family protein n=1 Tax=Desulfosporosinus sp. TaxID=157907 RepID=UPI0025C2A8A5|nr:UDP-glucose/GDP-mannose dehydrogenase family protein [Desulfosporosinus sp.]MBC2725513.1 UDP-glucose/GDP-mannose dehydrogenase family protein [Desulfosporosinus sp.]